MPDGREAVAVRVLNRIAEVPAAQWDACAGADVPFVRHAFLDALEESGAATAETGWLPQHLVIEDGDGGLLGAAPLYLKSHSYGEYVFDWAWADAYERAGGSYFPKLQCAVPFTPVTGPRLLVRPGVDQGVDQGADRESVADALIAAMVELARRHKVSSLHITYPTHAEWRSFGAAGMLQRVGLQYHWENRGYGDFDDFLADLSSRKRKAIKRERRQALDCGLRIEALTGADLRSAHWDAFYGFYIANSERKWGQAYLNREFFELLGDRQAESVALMLAWDDGQPVAGALNLIGGEALYGRNWGALGRFRFLHFEACYYQAIDFAIRHGLKRVEAGAQGEHKIQRGYRPVETYSAHWIRDAGFRDAVEHFLERERPAIRHEIAALAEHSPFRKADGER